MAKENHELPSRHKVSMKKEKREENQKGGQRATFLYLSALAYAFSRAKSKQCKSGANSANSPKWQQDVLPEMVQAPETRHVTDAV